MKYTAILYLLLFLNGCKTAKNGYFDIPVSRYDIDAVRYDNLNKVTPLDTVITLTIASGGTMRGVENNLFIFRKNNDWTQIDRISNFRKFKSNIVSDSAIKWDDITTNIQSYISDTIKEYIEVVEDGKTVIQGPASDGEIQRLDIYFNNIKHAAFLGPLVNLYNESNINLELINKLYSIVDNLYWTPTEKLKSKRSR